MRSSAFLCARRYEASAIQLVGIALIACGILGLGYGGLSYTTQIHDSKIGALEPSVKDTETVDPVWAGIGAIVIGGVALLAPKQT